MPTRDFKCTKCGSYRCISITFPDDPCEDEKIALPYNESIQAIDIDHEFYLSPKRIDGIF